MELALPQENPMMITVIYTRISLGVYTLKTGAFHWAGEFNRTTSDNQLVVAGGCPCGASGSPAPHVQHSWRKRSTRHGLAQELYLFGTGPVILREVTASCRNGLVLDGSCQRVISGVSQLRDPTNFHLDNPCEVNSYHPLKHAETKS